MVASILPRRLPQGLPLLLLPCVLLCILVMLACNAPSAGKSDQDGVSDSGAKGIAVADTEARGPAWDSLAAIRDSLLPRFTLYQSGVPMASYHHWQWNGRSILMRQCLMAGVDSVGHFYFIDCRQHPNKDRYTRTNKVAGKWYGFDTTEVVLEIEVDSSLYTTHIAPGLMKSWWPMPHPFGGDTCIVKEYLISTGTWDTDYFAVADADSLQLRLAQGIPHRMRYRRVSGGRYARPWQGIGAADREALHECALLAQVLRGM